MTAHWTLEDLYRGIMQSWWVLVGTVVVFAAAAGGLWYVFPQTYTAQAQLTVEPISVLSSGSTFNSVNMETERLVATSGAVLDRASLTLDGPSAAALRNATVVQVPRGSQVLSFEVTTAGAERSAEWANALAVTYGEQREGNAREVVERSAAALAESVKRLEELYNTQGEGTQAREAIELQLQSLLEQQARLAATPFYSGMLVTPAVAPAESNRPKIFVFVAGGLFLGAMIGGIAALLVSRARRGPSQTYRRAQKDSAGEPEERRPHADPGEDDAGPGPNDDACVAGPPTHEDVPPASNDTDETPHAPKKARERSLTASRPEPS